ncbi:MAG: ATP-dependent Clp protease ATP-binding subunit ClpC, partial [Maribacter sp.]
FTSRIIGQTSAIDSLCEIVKIYKAGLNNPHKPISTLLFAGPTGVGKTASARALADYFFGKGQKTSPLIRIDMSEFRYPGQIAQLIGSGRNVGKLVKDVRERPFAVLLLDEVEKADSSVFDALLTVLDEGRLVDAYGRETNFRNVIIIMTSNLGSSNRQSLGFTDMEDESVRYTSSISKFFRPEFINRIDGIVMFNALKEADIIEITKKELIDLSQREGFVKNNLKLKFSNNLMLHLKQTGFDERYGARPLQRAIEDEVTAPLANWLLNHPNTQNCTLEIDYDEVLKVNIA